MSHKFNRKYFPPIPTLEIELGDSGSSPIVGPLTALIDTGADGTLIPERILSRFEIVESDRVWIRSQWCEYHSALTYVLDIYFGARRLPAVRVVSDDRGNEVILGRDVLNKLRLLLDGPAETTEILDSKSRRK